MTPHFVHHTDPNYEPICQWVSARIWGEARDFGPGTAMAVMDGGQAAAAIVFHGYDRKAGVVEFSGAGDTKRWLTKPVLAAMFRYPFVELGCQAVFARVDPANRPLRRMLTAYGFDVHEIPRLRGRDKSEWLFVLTDDAWAANGFHKEQDYGQSASADAA